MPGRSVDRLTSAFLQVERTERHLIQRLREAAQFQAGQRPMSDEEQRAWRAQTDLLIGEAEVAAEELLWALRHYRLTKGEDVVPKLQRAQSPRRPRGEQGTPRAGKE